MDVCVCVCHRRVSYKCWGLQAGRTTGNYLNTELAASEQAVAMWTQIKGPGLTRSLAEAWADPVVLASMPEQAERARRALQVSHLCCPLLCLPELSLCICRLDA